MKILSAETFTFGVSIPGREVKQLNLKSVKSCDLYEKGVAEFELECDIFDVACGFEGIIKDWADGVGLDVV